MQIGKQGAEKNESGTRGKEAGTGRNRASEKGLLLAGRRWGGVMVVFLWWWWCGGVFVVALFMGVVVFL